MGYDECVYLSYQIGSDVRLDNKERPDATPVCLCLPRKKAIDGYDPCPKPEHMRTPGGCQERQG